MTFQNVDSIRQNYQTWINFFLILSGCYKFYDCKTTITTTTTTNKITVLIHILCVFWDRVSCSPGWPQTHYVAEDDLELLTLCPPLPKCEEYRHEPPIKVYMVLGIESRALRMLGKSPRPEYVYFVWEVSVNVCLCVFISDIFAFSSTCHITQLP